ncbi:MAG: acetate--CoA ligase family protein [Chlorobi bacterium]|nr:acetate--CoA ligase family protein [Chlorobiota bacterium]MCI0716655.1 acetate--CoA ligase family protein [Chlorobiota bacterium]
MNDSLNNLFYPKSIAVIGASAKEGTLSWELLNNLIKFGYKGKLFPVNPNAESIHSIKSYRRVSEIEDSIDLAIMMVSRKLVLDAIDDCHRKKISSVVVITAGFKESGAEGAILEEELVKRIKKYGIRLVGPNCMGIINTHNKIRLNATFVQGEPISGGIGFVSQSGALGAAVLKTLQQNDIGLSQFISIGNKADISGNAVIEYWKDDPDIKVITVYLESFGKPRRFMELSREITKIKPIIAIKSARTAQGIRAASSHTGALASSDTVTNALFEQSGVIRVSTIDEMFDIAKAFDKANLPKGSRLGILTNAGGPAILAIDESTAAGLTVPQLSKATQKKLRVAAPLEAPVFNPVDLLPSASAELYSSATRIMLKDSNIDSLIVILGPPLSLSTLEIAKSVSNACKDSRKTCMLVLMSQDEVISRLRNEAPFHPPVYRFPENAVRAIGKLLEYKNWQESETGEIIHFNTDKNSVRKILNKYKRSGEVYLKFEDVSKILNAYGMPVIESINSKNINELSRIAEKLKYPVVIKAMGRNLIHKSDVGGVETDIHTEADLIKAARNILENLGRHKKLKQFEYFLIQPYIRCGVETIIGITKDENAGHLIMFGLGGIFVEVLNDVKFKLLPIRNSEAKSMVRSIKSYKLLTGIRARKAVDINYIEENLLRLSQLIEDFPEFTEVDLNPFIFTDKKEECKILDARMKVVLNNRYAD